jgi:hypothetical protein
MSENFSNLYNLISSKFNVSSKDIEDLDMQDGKQDGRINGIHLSVFFKDSSVSFGNIKASIGELLNSTEEVELPQSKFYGNDNGKTKSGALSLEKLMSKYRPNDGRKAHPTKEIVDELVKQIYGIGNCNLDEGISWINENNVVDVIESYQKVSDQKNSIAGHIIDHETLIEAILDENIGDEKKKKYISSIKNALVSRITTLRGSANFTADLFDKLFDSVLKKWWPFQDSSKLDALVNEMIKTIKQLERMTKAGEEVTPEKAVKMNKRLISELRKDGVLTDDMLGDGYFNNNAMQMSGNCWIHAGINAMLEVPKTREYLNNLITKTSNGNIAVYLPGAKRDNLPKPKGDGIFVYTPKDVSKAIKTESAGDGDYTALMLAIRDYRIASGSENKTTEGGNLWDFSEIVYEKKPNIVIFADRKSKNSCEMAKWAQNKDASTNDEKIITNEEIELQSGLDDYNKMYKNIKKAFEANSYIFMVSISGKNYDNLLLGKPVSVDNDSGHALSIISMSDTEVLLKDSNYPNDPLRISAMDFVKVCRVTGMKVPA